MCVCVFINLSEIGGTNAYDGGDFNDCQCSDYEYDEIALVDSQQPIKKSPWCSFYLFTLQSMMDYDELSGY